MSRLILLHQVRLVRTNIRSRVQDSLIDVADTVPLPLLALLHRRLGDDDMADVVAELICLRQPAMDAVDMGVAISRITGELPSVVDIEHIQTVLSNVLKERRDWRGLSYWWDLAGHHGHTDIYIDERIDIVDAGRFWLIGFRARSRW